MTNNLFDEKSNSPILLSSIFPCLKYFLSKKKIFKIFILVFLFFLLCSIWYMFIVDKKTKDKVLLARETRLNAEIAKLENKNDMLEAEIILLKNEIQSLYKKHEQKKINKISQFIANKELTGEGVIIILQDSKNSEVEKDEMAIIHNTDLLKLVNFLWKNDAIAISINGERIVQNSAISCIGPTILINKKRISSPFKIIALGKKLTEKNIQNSAIMLLLKYRGIELVIEKNNNLTVPAGKYSNNR